MKAFVYRELMDLTEEELINLQLRLTRNHKLLRLALREREKMRKSVGDSNTSD